MSAGRIRAVIATTITPAIATVLTTLGVTAGHAEAQALATRIAAVEGAVTVQFATRAAACGDGREFIALGTHMQMNGGYRLTASGWWARQPCVHGPARVVLTVRAGVVTDVAVHVGTLAADDDVGRGGAARELGPVRAADAAAYFVTLAGRTAGDAATRAVAEHAVIAAAVADSADVWRPLLALARSHADERVARSAVQWLGAAAPADAVSAVAAMFRDASVPRAVREGAAVALSFAPNGVGVPALDAAARGSAAAGGDDPWVRDRAVFWLGNAGDPRARATLRALAAADSAPEPVRAQAIFALGHLDRGTATDGIAGDGPAGDGPAPNAAFLRALYPTLTSALLQDRTVQSIAQAADAASRRWLFDLAADARQPIAARTRALFWAGQRRDRSIDDLLAVDGRLTGVEIRRQYAFVLSQRDEDAAVDRLIAMAHADAEPAVRRQALFWLGQSRSPRARTYLESVVAR